MWMQCLDAGDHRGATTAHQVQPWPCAATPHSFLVACPANIVNFTANPKWRQFEDERSIRKHALSATPSNITMKTTLAPPAGKAAFASSKIGAWLPAFLLDLLPCSRSRSLRPPVDDMLDWRFSKLKSNGNAPPGREGCFSESKNVSEVEFRIHIRAPHTGKLNNE